MARKTENKETGWICLHRAFREWQHYGEPIVKSVFLDLLLSVNSRDGWWHGFKCERGATFRSIRTMAEDTKLNPLTIRRALAKLEQTGEIKRIKIDQKHTKTIVCNFAKYQDFNPFSVLPSSTQSNTQGNTQSNTKQQYNNNNNIVVDNKCARTHEEIVNELFESRITIEQFCKNEGITLDQCRELAEQILVEWELVGVRHHTESEVKRHFIDHLRKKVQAMNITRKPLNERKADFLAECKALIAKGCNREQVAEFARYYTQPTADGRMLFETFKGWATETRFLLMHKSK